MVTTDTRHLVHRNPYHPVRGKSASNAWYTNFTYPTPVSPFFEGIASITVPISNLIGVHSIYGDPDRLRVVAVLIGSRESRTGKGSVARHYIAVHRSSRLSNTTRGTDGESTRKRRPLHRKQRRKEPNRIVQPSD